MPIRTTRPPGQSGSKTPAAALALPLASKTMSAPQPSVISLTTSTRFSCATLTGVIGPSDRGQVELRLHHVGHDDPAAAAGQRGQRGDHADGARAHDDGDVAGLDRGLVGRVHADGQRLDHRALGEADVVGQLEGEVGGMDDRRAQDAVDRRRGPEAHGRVEVVHAEASGLAVRVGDARLHADAVADLQVRDLAADLDDDAGSLVAQHHRRADDERTDCAVSRSSARRCRRRRPCGCAMRTSCGPNGSSISISRRLSLRSGSNTSASMTILLQSVDCFLLYRSSTLHAPERKQGAWAD